MSTGYIGPRTKRRRRHQLLFILLILLIGTIVLFAYNANNVDVEIVEVEKIVSQEENSISIKKLKTKLLGTEQRLLLRDNLIDSLKNQTNALEENNNELIKAIEHLNLENTQNNLESRKLQKDNLVEIEQLQKTIDKLNKEINKLNKEIKQNNDNYVFLKNENDKIQNLVGILDNNNNTLELQKDIAFKRIEELKKTVIKKDKLIKGMKDKIHH